MLPLLHPLWVILSASFCPLTCTCVHVPLRHAAHLPLCNPPHLHPCHPTPALVPHHLLVPTRPSATSTRCHPAPSSPVPSCHFTPHRDEDSQFRQSELAKQRQEVQQRAEEKERAAAAALRQAAAEQRAAEEEAEREELRLMNVQVGARAVGVWHRQHVSAGMVQLGELGCVNLHHHNNHNHNHGSSSRWKSRDAVFWRMALGCRHACCSLRTCWSAIVGGTPS